MPRMKKALRILFALPPFILLAVAVIYVSDVGGARQPMADDYFGLVERLIRPVTDDYRERAEDNMRKQQERRLTPAPSASTPP